MAFEIPGFSMSLEASGDLSAAQFHCVEVDSNGQVTVANAAGESVFGILQNKPTAQGVAASIMKDGVSKVVAGAAITAGALVQTNGAGRVVVVGSGDFVVGRALDSVGADGEIVSIGLGENHRTA